MCVYNKTYLDTLRQAERFMSLTKGFGNMKIVGCEATQTFNTLQAANSSYRKQILMDYHNGNKLKAIQDNVVRLFPDVRFTREEYNKYTNVLVDLKTPMNQLVNGVWIENSKRYVAAEENLKWLCFK